MKVKVNKLEENSKNKNIKKKYDITYIRMLTNSRRASTNLVLV